MLTLDQIVSGLEDRNLKIVSEKSGVNYLTVTKIANGSQTNPQYRTLKALSDYLEGKRD